MNLSATNLATSDFKYNGIRVILAINDLKIIKIAWIVINYPVLNYTYTTVTIALISQIFRQIIFRLSLIKS